MWLQKTLASCVLFVGGLLVLSAAGKKYDLAWSPNVIFGLVSGIVSLIALSFPSIRGEISESREALPMLVCFGLAFALGNFLFFSAVSEAPNPGFPRAVLSLELILTMLLSAFLFGSELKTRDVGAVIMILVGVVIISMR